MVAGMVLLLLLSVGHAFSFVYAYTVAFFKGAELPVVLLGAAIMVIPAISRDAVPRDENDTSARWPRWCRILALAIGLATVVVAMPRQPEAIEVADSVFSSAIATGGLRLLNREALSQVSENRLGMLLGLGPQDTPVGLGRNVQTLEDLLFGLGAESLDVAHLMRFTRRAELVQRGDVQFAVENGRPLGSQAGNP